MLFADEPGQIPGWLLFVFGGAGGGVLGTAGAFLMKLLDRRKTDAKERKDEEDKDEETALGRLEKVMRLREEDCDRRINELTVRVADLERNRDARQVERDAMRDKLAIYAARVKYLEYCCRAGIKPDDWDKPDTAPDGGLPSVDTSPKRGE